MSAGHVQVLFTQVASSYMGAPYSMVRSLCEDHKPAMKVQTPALPEVEADPGALCQDEASTHMRHVGYTHSSGTMASPLTINSVVLRAGIVESARAGLRVSVAQSLRVGNQTDDSPRRPRVSPCAAKQPPTVAKQLLQPPLAARCSWWRKRPRRWPAKCDLAAARCSQEATTYRQTATRRGLKVTKLTAGCQAQPVDPWWCETITRCGSNGPADVALRG